MDIFIAIFIILLLSAFFSGMEIAFITADKFRIELKSKQGVITAKILSGFIQNQSHFIGTTLVGNNIALVIYGIIMGGLLNDTIRNYLPNYFNSDFVVIILQTVIATFIVIIAGEFLPKALFRIIPDKLLNFFAIPMLGFYYLFYPIVYLLVLASKFILSAIGVKYTDTKPIIGRGDLINYINENAIRLNEKEEVDSEIMMFKNALSFSRVKVRECMIPRTEIQSIDLNEPIENLVKKFAETGLSKVLIYEKTPENIVGFVHVFDMFNKPEKTSQVLLSVDIVPESKYANELLTLFIEKRKSIALVIDEYGVTSGIVTLEDLLEEIVGEISDEYDSTALLEKQISENEFIFSARLEIDYLNEKYKLNIAKKEEYKTLGGYIISKHENIPQKLDKLIIDNFIITVIEVSSTKIEKVQLQVINNLEFED